MNAATCYFRREKTTLLAIFSHVKKFSFLILYRALQFKMIFFLKSRFLINTIAQCKRSRFKNRLPLVYSTLTLIFIKFEKHLKTYANLYPDKWQ
jgi:hypothetical protein